MFLIWAIYSICESFLTGLITNRNHNWAKKMSMFTPFGESWVWVGVGWVKYWTPLGKIIAKSFLTKFLQNHGPLRQGILEKILRTQSLGNPTRLTLEWSRNVSVWTWKNDEKNDEKNEKNDETRNQKTELYLCVGVGVGVGVGWCASVKKIKRGRWEEWERERERERERLANKVFEMYLIWKSKLKKFENERLNQSNNFPTWFEQVSAKS